MAAKSFTELMGEEELKYFNEVASKPFNQQAMAFLNAYWPEVQDQAEFIFTVAYEVMKYADMHAKGISLAFKYEDGVDLDFNIGLYFYERLVKFLEDPKNAKWAGDEFKPSHPELLTALKRKQELREKVDVNFDGRVSFLEYLLYQYHGIEGVDPANFCVRAMTTEEHPEVTKARLALQAVNKSIQAYEEEKARLTELSESGTGVKAMRAKNELAQLGASPLWETLQMNLIRAESLMRRVTKKFGGGAGGGAAGGSSSGGSTFGSVWWMNRDLEEKQKRYGPMKK